MTRTRTDVIVSLLMGLLWWTVHGIYDWGFFSDASLTSVLFSDIPPHLFWIRLVQSGVVFAAVLVVKLSLTDRNHALERAEMLNSILLGIRSISRLILEADDPRTFLRAVCGTLTARTGCLRAWIVLLETSGEFKLAVQSNCGEGFAAKENVLRSENYPSCVTHALEKKAVALTDWGTGCRECQFGTCQEDCATLSAPMIHDDRLFGVLIVTMKTGKTVSDEEQQLFGLVAQDVALALRRIEASEKNRLHEVILNGIQNRVTITDLHGKILYVNRATSDALQRPTDEIIGEGVDIHGDSPEHGATQEEILRETLANGTWRGEVLNTAKDGSRSLMDVCTWLVRDSNNNPTYMAGVGIDVTERRAAENKLRASEERFRSLYSSMGEGVAVHELVYDEKGEPVDYRILDVNPAYERIIGLKRDAAIGSLGSELYGTKSPPYLDAFASVALGGEIQSFETYFEPMRKYFSLSIFSPKSGIFATVFFDITERKKSERLQTLLYTAIEQSAESIVILDQNWYIEYVNRAAEKTSGYSRGELLGKDTEIFLSDRHSRAFYDNIRNLIRAGESWNGTLISRKSNGEHFEEETVVSPVFDEHGSIVHVVVVKRDMTNEQRLENQLRHSQRIEAVGKLAGGIAHDFNNLLQAIQGYSEFLVEDLPAGTEAHQFAGEIKTSARKAAALTRQLLAFSRRQVLERGSVNVNDIANDMLNIIGRTLGEHIEVVLNKETETGWIYADRGQIEQVLMNLCVNARDAMPDGGQLSINTTLLQLDQPPSASGEAFSPGPYVRLSVRDTGSGMTEETLQHVFEPFFTTKETGKGTGLGLSTVYGIVNQHGGHVGIKSSPGQGSIFSVYLPQDAKRQPAEVVTEKEQNPDGGNETILLAEDDAGVRRLVKRLLESAGYRVLATNDGNETVEVGTRQINAIDMAMLDVVMPKMGGKEVAVELRRLRPELPVIFSSGYSEKDVAAGIDERHTTAIVSKPYGINELLAAVRSILTGKTQDPQ